MEKLESGSWRSGKSCASARKHTKSWDKRRPSKPTDDEERLRSRAKAMSAARPRRKCRPAKKKKANTSSGFIYGERLHQQHSPLCSFLRSPTVIRYEECAGWKNLIGDGNIRAARNRRMSPALLFLCYFLLSLSGRGSTRAEATTRAQSRALMVVNTTTDEE